MPVDPQRLAQDARVHDLKCLPDYFEAVISGAKTHETRKDDRGFKVGDILRLREWSDTRWHRSDGYSGRVEERRVSYIAHPSPHTPIPEGYVVMSLAHLDALAAGEGLDWPAMFQEALDGASTPTNAFQSFSVPEVARDIIDRHHRAIVGALRAKLAQSEARVQELERDDSLWVGEVLSMVDTALKAHGVDTAPMFFDDQVHRVFRERDALRGALEKYGMHHGYCPQLRTLSERGDCTCGLDAALAAYRGTK